jgi:deazaflavin-dependent oxidoreductase (nitroreductase family)
VEEERNMTKTYRLTPITRVVNAIFSAMTRRGRGAEYRYVLTVQGRKSGVARSTPVDVMEVGGQRWLVAPYGDVNWVKNVRAAGQLDLSRGGSFSRWKAEEVQGLEAAPAIRRYIKSVPVTRPYWEVASESSDEALSAASEHHPVFRLAPLPNKPS